VASTNQPTAALTPTTDIFRYESIDAKELGRRLGNLPESWVREHVRTRYDDPIPCVRYGKYVRFLWGCPDLAKWIERHLQSERPPQSNFQPVAEKPQIKPRRTLQ